MDRRKERVKYEELAIKMLVRKSEQKLNLNEVFFEVCKRKVCLRGGERGEGKFQLQEIKISKFKRYSVKQSSTT